MTSTEIITPEIMPFANKVTFPDTGRLGLKGIFLKDPILLSTGSEEKLSSYNHPLNLPRIQRG